MYHTQFLAASTHLYKRLCPSVRRSVTLVLKIAEDQLKWSVKCLLALCKLHFFIVGLTLLLYVPFPTYCK